jgi:glucose-6-phosphate dehydrogenase assembly protein OpcA
MVAKSEPRPILATSFQSATLDTGVIHDELNRLWVQLGGPTHGGQWPGEMVADSHFGGGGLMRANTLNLVAAAHNLRDAELITDTVSRLHDFLPSRTIILISEDREEGTNDRQFNVRLELKEQVTGKDVPSLHFETITIAAASDQLANLPSLVSPLLSAELPAFLWWPAGDFARHQLFGELQELVNRAVIDSAQLGNDIAGLTVLRSLFGEADEDAPVFGDFTWLRLAPWRQLIAQFFDPPDVQECLTTIEEVTISYADLREDGSSGLAAAVLTVGWLASRLGWEVREPLEKRKAGGWTAPLRASNGDRQRDVSLRLLPDRSPHAMFSLRHVEILAGGKHPGKFRIERTDADDMVTSSQTETVPYVSRMVYAKRPTSVNMLGQELQQFGPDRVYEEAVAKTLGLLP